jgi:hypothetical protein
MTRSGATTHGTQIRVHEDPPPWGEGGGEAHARARRARRVEYLLAPLEVVPEPATRAKTPIQLARVLADSCILSIKTHDDPGRRERGPIWKRGLGGGFAADFPLRLCAASQDDDDAHSW